MLAAGDDSGRREVAHQQPAAADVGAGAAAGAGPQQLQEEAGPGVQPGDPAHGAHEEVRSAAGGHGGEGATVGGGMCHLRIGTLVGTCLVSGYSSGYLPGVWVLWWLPAWWIL